MGIYLLSLIMNYGVKRALATGRKTVRKAGQKLLDVDEAYAGKVADLHGSVHEAPLGHMTSGTPIREFFKESANVQADTKTERVIGEAMKYGLLGANVASRYALPAGGVTLAGKALIDLTNGFGGAADQPEQATLPM